MNSQPMPGQHRVATLVADPAERRTTGGPALPGACRPTGRSLVAPAGAPRSWRACGANR